MRKSLIEAMARAINPEAWEDDGGWCKTFQFSHRRAALDRATVALDAALSILESPSDDMLEAGQEICGKAYVGHGFESEIAEPEGVFAAMLNTLKAPA